MMNPNRRLAAIFTPIWPAPTLQGSGSETLREGLRKSNYFCLSSVCHSLPWQHWPLIGGLELHDGAVTAKCLDRWAGHRLRAVTEAGSSGAAEHQGWVPEGDSEEEDTFHRTQLSCPPAER